MKNRSKFKILFMTCLFMVNVSNVFAHSGNVTGYQEKESNKISFCNNKYYAFHKQNDVYHYHEVSWDNDKAKWIIINKDETFSSNPCGHENERVKVTLSSCVDGDTAKFNLNDEVVTTRFLAVDTPETVHPTKEVMMFGKEASTFTCQKLTNAKEIYFEYDQGSDKYDKYNRHLVWIFVDNKLLQSLLIENGYAKVEYIYGDYKYTNELLSKQEVAKESKLNIWSIDNYEVKEDVSSIKDEENEKSNMNLENIIYIVGVIVVSMFLVPKRNVITKKRRKR